MGAITEVAGIAGKILKGAFKGVKAKIQRRKAQKAAAKALNLQSESEAAIAKGLNKIGAPLSEVQAAVFNGDPKSEYNPEGKKAEPSAMDKFNALPMWQKVGLGAIAFFLLMFGFKKISKR
jgi:hypothetical protein